MKTRFRFLIYGVFALVLTMTSCEKEGLQGPTGTSGTMGEQGIQGETGPQGPAGEDGEALGVPGPQGEQGESGATGSAGAVGVDGENGSNGTDGENGTDGTNGSDGNDGSNGTNGTDGEDGNANVRAFVYDMSAKSGATIIQNVPEITQDVLENDVILGFLKTVDREFNPIPAPRFLAAGLKDVAVDFEIGKYQFFFYEVGNSSLTSITAGTLDELKVIIIESTSTTSGKSSPEQVLENIKSAGVDLNDYVAVMNYFGLEH